MRPLPLRPARRPVLFVAALVAAGGLVLPAAGCGGRQHETPPTPPGAEARAVLTLTPVPPDQVEFPPGRPEQASKASGR